MALRNGLAGACDAITKAMANLQGINYAFNLSTINGTLDFLFSEFNLRAAGAEQLELQDQRGKIKRARVVYSQRAFNGILTGQDAIDANLCDAGVTPEEKEVFVDITKRIATPVLQFTNQQLNEICENPIPFMNKHLFSYLAAAREELSKDLLTSMQANAGIILGHNGTDTAAGTARAINLLATASTGDTVPLKSNFGKIRLDYQKMRLRGFPAIIGEGNIQEYYELAALACCNATTPFEDALAQSKTAFFLDQNANEILGDNHFLSVAPGSAMVLTFNENKSLGINAETQKHILLPDPVVPGLTWDLDMRLSACGKQYDWFASVWYEPFFTFQDDSFYNSGASPSLNDPLAGITGIAEYVANVAS